MKSTISPKFQLLLAVVMFLVSVFMAIDYGLMIAHHEADRLNTFAFYVWLFSIVAWFVKVVHEFRILYAGRQINR